MTDVYLVIASGGEYEDYWERIEKAFFDEEMAIKFVEEKDIELKILQEIETEKSLQEFTDEEMRKMTFEAFQENCITDYNLLDQSPYRIQRINVE